MKGKNFFIFLSLTLVAAFLTGLVPALLEIVSHRYFHFKAYRLIALSFSKSWNTTLLWGACGVALFGLIWIIIRLTAKTSPDLTTRIAAGWAFLGGVVGILIRLHEIGLQGGSIYYRKIGYLKHGFSRLLTGEVSLGRVLHLNPIKIGIIAASLLALAAIVFLTILTIKGIRKIPWERFFGKFNRHGRFLKISAASAVLITGAMNLAAWSLGRKSVSSRMPNIVWITIDALRADHLGCYGYEKKTSPFIDSLAAKGILFQRAFSQESYTQASVPSFFTSTYPFRHRCLSGQSRMDRLDPRFLTVAEALKNAGFRTAALVFSPYMFAKFNFGQGFDLYDDHIEGGGANVPLYKQSETAIRALNDLESLLTVSKDKPLFLYIHYRDVHVPYAPPPPFHKTFLPEGVQPLVDILYKSKIPNDPAHKDLWVSQYDGEILYTDTVLEKTFALFHERGLVPENTIFLITADHGDEFWDNHPGDEGGQGHTRTLYNELIRVPLIISLPKMIGSRAIDTPVELNDVFPTLLDALGIGNTARDQIQGQSLMPLLRGEDFPKKPVISGGRQMRGAIIQDGWKFIFRITENKDSRETSVKEELYNLESDFGETVDLIENDKARAGKLKEMLLKAQNAPGMKGRPSPVPIDEKTKEQLKTLGYIK